jgi:hypothetical protein
MTLVKTGLSALLAGALLVSCAPEPTAAQATSLVLLAADDDGALLTDGDTQTLRGFDRTGREIWSDAEVFVRGTTARCLGRCPDAVLLADPRVPTATTRQVVAGVRSAFPVGLSGDRLLLSVRSATDFVTVEQDPSGAAAVHIHRADGKTLAVPVPTTDLLWQENPAGTVAMALPADPDTAAGTVLSFRHDDRGWLPTKIRFPSAGLWDACVAGDGELALLPGPGAVMIVGGGHRVPVRTDLAEVAECVLGRDGGAVVHRSLSSDGAVRTEVRGVDTEGRQTWSRDYRVEAQLATNPAGSLVAVTGGGRLELVDTTGTMRSTMDDVVAARFTPAGRLVTVSAGGAVRWHDV